jgi:hypothetical protein
LGEEQEGGKAGRNDEDFGVLKKQNPSFLPAFLFNPQGNAGGSE